MPVDLRRHDPDDTITIRPGTNKAAIIKLLYRDTNLGYTPAEIRESLDLPRGTTSTTLSRLHDDGLIGKTSDGLYHGLEHRDDVRRFARSLVQLDDMAARYPDPGLTPDDVEQTGTGARRELPRDRTGTDEDGSGEEPAPSDWINSTNTSSTPNSDSDSVSGERQ
jgi:cobalamin biosynthesis protein CobT